MGDSTELGNPPQKFEKVMKMASEEGYRLVSHAGEEGPAEYVRDAIDILNVDQIDHGVRSVDDDKLVERIAKMRMPLTLCPLSNLKLCVVDKMEDLQELAKNSFEACFAPETQKKEWMKMVDTYCN